MDRTSGNLRESDKLNNKKNYIIDYDVDIVNSGNIRSLLLNFNTNLQVINHIGHRFELYDMNNNQLQSIRINYPETPCTEFKLRLDNIPNSPTQLKFWFYNILSIEEKIK